MILKTEHDYTITTVYIGGGTPSYVESRYIKELMSILKLQIDTAEVTIEINPGTITAKKLLQYRQSGINRLSIGLQSTNNRILKKIGRIHTYEQFEETFNLARRVGFKNINVDLMIGLPDQKITDVEKSIQKVIDLEPEHISVYSLILEESSSLYKMVKSGIVKLPTEKKEREMYWNVKNTLEENGYNHYEISNFSKPGMESKHNVNCWKQKEYIGIGLGASSYLAGIRYSNVSDLKRYMDNVEAGKIDYNMLIEEKQKKEDMQKEYMLLNLRMINGVSIQEFKDKFEESPIDLYKEILEKLIQEELIMVDVDSIKLTNKGIDLANQVWMEFA